MKGAIGNAMIMNIVITFMLIFFSLLIGSMAYSKAYKTKNFFINLIDQYEREGKFFSIVFDGDDWETDANEYLGKVGYTINRNSTNTCPSKEEYGYTLLQNNASGYNYCIYGRTDIKDEDNNPTIEERHNYMVLVYMQLDIPVLGEFIRIPITGETKSYTVLR